MTVLDVGQGLAVVVRTAAHSLVYDTGVKYPYGSDMGQMVLLPYLDYLHIQQIDRIVISHPDLDHRGGLPTLLARYPNTTLLVDDPSKYKEPAFSCHHFLPWQWDGVRFEFLPILNASLSKNNHSCVLKISTAHSSMLLTGDIEMGAENDLVERYASRLAADVLLVPHHGSKTSSSQRFLDVVSPHWAIVSYALENRYHFPHFQAMNRYQNILLYATAVDGTVYIDMKKNKPVRIHHF